MKAAWDLFDRDHNGHITMEELGKLYQSLGQNFTQVGRSRSKGKMTGSEQEEIGDFMAEVDQDKNGTIEFQEFLALMVRQLRQSSRSSH